MSDRCIKCGGSMRVIDVKNFGCSGYSILACNCCSKVIVGNNNIKEYRIKMASKYSGKKIVDEIFKGLDEI